MVGVLARHGYMKTGDGDMRPKPYRPKSIGDARALITEVFERNKWDERDIRVYLEMKLGPQKAFESLTPDEVRIVLAAMEKSKMLIFRET